MPDVQTIAAFIFLLGLLLFFLSQRKKFHVQSLLFPLLYFALYKTQLGLKAMNSLAKKFPRGVSFLGTTGVIVGFLGMAFIAFTLIHNIYNLLTTSTAQAGVALVLPVKVKGTFFVPFFYWIISIFILAVVHEFSHGVMARRFGIKIKSSGFAFLAIFIPILPAAFVEPNEKQLVRKPKKEQLAVFAAGPFSNILLAIVVVLISLGTNGPISDNVLEQQGVQITGFVEDSFPARQVGMEQGDIITKFDNNEVHTVDQFTEFLSIHEPGDKVTVGTDSESHSVILSEHPDDPEAAYLGVYVQQKTGFQEDFTATYGAFTAHAIVWFSGLLFWLFVLNIGIGLFNLLPLGPIDGGRMLRTAMHHLFDPVTGDKIWKNVSIFFLVLLIVNLGFAFVR